MQRLVQALLAAALVVAPLGAESADLVVWWEKGYYAQEDEAVAEIVAAFEQQTGMQVDLEQPSQDDMEAKVLAAVEAGCEILTKPSAPDGNSACDDHPHHSTPNRLRHCKGMRWWRYRSPLLRSSCGCGSPRSNR